MEINMQLPEIVHILPKNTHTHTHTHTHGHIKKVIILFFARSHYKEVRTYFPSPQTFSDCLLSLQRYTFCANLSYWLIEISQNPNLRRIQHN